MRSMLVLFRWECRRILSNWRQTLAIFLVPALVLLLALYFFPLLVDYISTGNVGNPSVILVAPDDSILSFVESDTLASSYSYIIWTEDEYTDALADGSAAKFTEKGNIFIVFGSGDAESADYGEESFRKAIEAYIRDLPSGADAAATTATITIDYDPYIIKSEAAAYQFQENILPGYKDYLIFTSESNFYSEGGGAPFRIDRFNPYTKLMENKSQANPAAARVIPGVLILLLYYYVFSLSGDIFATDRERGFLSKLALTPLSTHGLLWGKALAVISVSTLASLITLLVIILSSWLNRSNNPLSLIPFGLLLSPLQLIMILGSVFCAAAVMTMLCFKIIADLRNMQDITLNMQLPLILFLVDFFLQLFRMSDPVLAEFAIPLHNNLLLIHHTMIGTASVQLYMFVIIWDTLTVSLLYIYTKRTFEQDTIIRKKRKTDHRRHA